MAQPAPITRDQVIKQLDKSVLLLSPQGTIEEVSFLMARMRSNCPVMITGKGYFALRPHYKEAGWRFYREVCVAEGAAWKCDKLLSYRNHYRNARPGALTQPFPEDFYPKELAARLANNGVSKPWDPTTDISADENIDESSGVELEVYEGDDSNELSQDRSRKTRKR